MKNQVLTSVLLKGLEAAQKVNKAMGKINMDKITISVDGDKMTVNSIDFVNQSVLTIPVEASENFSVAIIGIEKMVKGLKKFNAYTSFEVDADKIIVTDGKKKLQLPLASSDKDDVKTYIQNKPFIVDGIRLNEAFTKVKKSIAKEESRPILCGVHFKNNFIETVDGYRISQVDIMQEYMDHDFVVNPKGLELILPVAKKDKLPVTIDICDNKAILTIENNEYNLTILSDLYQGEFLKTDTVFTNDYEHMLSFNENKEVVNELEFIKDMAGVSESGKPLPIRYIIDNDKLTIADTSENTSTEVVHAGIDGKVKDTFKIAFNPVYMIDAIKNISGEFTMQFISPMTPCIIKNETEKYLVLPIRMAA